MNSRVTGADAEMLVCAYIEDMGMHVLERNWQFGNKEIDIIARDGDTYAFIEVKARESTKYGSAKEAVTLAKRKNIIAATTGYMKQHKLFDKHIRFDVAALQSGVITYIKSAFDATYTR